jgi:hypothetical protein
VARVLFSFELMQLDKLLLRFNSEPTLPRNLYAVGVH